MTEDRKLEPLQRITAMLLDAELAKLNLACGEVAARRAEIDRLAAVRAARAAAVKAAEPGSDLAFETGQDARWTDWMAAERSRLAGEMARAATRAEAQRLAAQRAFGRNQALARIAARRVEARQLRVTRRAQATAVDPTDRP